MRERKIKVASLPSLIEGAGMNGFEYPTDYKMDYAMFHRCKYCKGLTLSRRMSLFGDSLVYSCVNCGGREKCTPEGILKQKKIVTILAGILLAIVLILTIAISANAAEVTETDNVNSENVYSAEADELVQEECDFLYAQN